MDGERRSLRPNESSLESPYRDPEERRESLEDRFSTASFEEHSGDDAPNEPSEREVPVREVPVRPGEGLLSGDGPSPEGGIEDLKIGAILQLAREEKELTLQEAEDATKIRKRYLKALESDDYTALPDPVYILGFLRTYGNYLGLDGERLADEVKRRRARRRDQRQNNFKNLRRGRLERQTVVVQGVSGARRRLVTPPTLLTVLVSILLIALVIGFLYLVGSSGRLGLVALSAATEQILPWARSLPPV